MEIIGKKRMNKDKLKKREEKRNNIMKGKGKEKRKKKGNKRKGRKKNFYKVEPKIIGFCAEQPNLLELVLTVDNSISMVK